MEFERGEMVLLLNPFGGPEWDTSEIGIITECDTEEPPILAEDLETIIDKQPWAIYTIYDVSIGCYVKRHSRLIEKMPRHKEDETKV